MSKSNTKKMPTPPSVDDLVLVLAQYKQVFGGNSFPTTAEMIQIGRRMNDMLMNILECHYAKAKKTERLANSADVLTAEYSRAYDVILAVAHSEPIYDAYGVVVCTMCGESTHDHHCPWLNAKTFIETLK